MKVERNERTLAQAGLLRLAMQLALGGAADRRWPTGSNGRCHPFGHNAAGLEQQPRLQSPTIPLEPSAGAFFAAIMLTFTFCSMKRKLKRLIGRSAIFAALVWPLLCSAQGTLQIAFEGIPPQPPGTSIYVRQYFESGMWFRPLGVVGPGNGFSHRRGGGGVSFAPDSGTAYLAAAQGDSLVFSFENGSLFGVVSVDLAEYSTLFATPLTVPFVGYRPDGSTVNTSFTTDGIIDGDGSLADFETFYFGPEFSSLTRVEVPIYGWSLDNLVVSVPEPGTGALLVIGTLTFLFWRMKRRK